MSQSPVLDIQNSMDTLTEDERYLLFATERRRLALDILASTTAPVELTDLAVSIAKRERETDTATERAVEQAKIALHHNHLPRMDDLDVLDYDPERTRIESCCRLEP